MTTESKKLQTTPMQVSVAVSHAEKLGPSHLLPGSLYADLAHDARIAHEQREALGLCVKALRGHERADVALGAASAFLED